jgi:hypothetical protein
MVAAVNVIYASVVVELNLICSVVFEQNPVAIRRSLILLVFVFVIFHVALVGRFEIDFRLLVVWIFRSKVSCDKRSIRLLHLNLISFLIHGLCELVFFWEQFTCHLDLILVNHVFKSWIESIVEVTQDKVVVRDDVGVHFLPFNLKFADNIFDHLIPCDSLILPMDKVATDEVELVIAVFEVDLDSSLVANHSCNTTFFVFGNYCGYLPTLHVLHENYQDYLVHRVFSHQLQPLPIHEGLKFVQECRPLW